MKHVMNLEVKKPYKILMNIEVITYDDYIIEVIH